MKTSRRIAMAVAAVSVTLSQGCSPVGSSHSDLRLAKSFFTPGAGELNPSTDKRDADCAKAPEFDACLFDKNPVAQEGKAVDLEKWDQYRNFGVKIRGIVDSLHLENPYLQVLTVSTPRISLRETDRFKAPLSDKSSTAEQLSAYYWANRAREYLARQVGEQRLPQSALKIYADDAFTGYSSGNRSIHLEKTPGRASKALSGEIVIQLFGQALADNLSGGRLFPGSSAQHKNCVKQPRGCCLSDLGCSQALATAFGDYVSGTLFPNSARLGESLAGNVGGQMLCQWPRDLSAIGNRSRANAFAACTSAPGHVTVLGAWYAARWWNLRQAAKALGPEAVADIDILFFEHARAWTGASTFADARSAAIKAATDYKSGKYLELVSRTLTIN